MSLLFLHTVAGVCALAVAAVAPASAAPVDTINKITADHDASFHAAANGTIDRRLSSSAFTSAIAAQEVGADLDTASASSIAAAVPNCVSAASIANTDTYAPAGISSA